MSRIASARDDLARVEEFRYNSDTAFVARSWDGRMLKIRAPAVKE
jgi:hypothetical protein